MNLQSFINKYNGKSIDYDGVYGYQCMDLMNQYVQEVLGIGSHPLGAPTAYQSYLKGASQFDKINNTPKAVPTPGDIVYWNTSVGSAGHVAVFIDGNTSTFRSFDQNWPTGSKCHIQTHNYNGVAGWLRLKTTNNQGAPMEEKVNAGDIRNIYNAILGREPDAGASGYVGDNWKDFTYSLLNSAEFAQRISNFQHAIEAVATMRPQLETLDSQVKDLTKQVTDLHTQLATQTDDTTNLNALGSALQWIIKRLGLK